MAEVLFYHLTQSPLERTLPDLLAKSLQRGWRVAVKGGRPEGITFLDDVLWTYNDGSFLPHGTEDGASQPIFLTCTDDVPNAADIVFLVDGAEMSPDMMAKFTRVCLLFDGNDPGTVDAARGAWKQVTNAALPAVYWAQDNGRWVQKAVVKP